MYYLHLREYKKFYLNKENVENAQCTWTNK